MFSKPVFGWAFIYIERMILLKENVAIENGDLSLIKEDVNNSINSFKASMPHENYFQKLYDVDVSEKVKEKNGLSYLSWAAAWAEVKKRYPDANYTIYENADGRFWFDDGRTGWVKTGVTIFGIEHIERLPVLDFKNKSISADNITSYDANKAVQRSLTKACGRHGLGLYIYEGEDLPESAVALTDLNDNNFKLVSKISKTNPDSKKELLDIISKYASNGNPKSIKDISAATELNKELLEFMTTKKGE